MSDEKASVKEKEPDYAAYEKDKRILAAAAETPEEYEQGIKAIAERNGI